MIGAAWLWLLRNPLSAVLGGVSLACFIAAGVQTWRLGGADDELKELRISIAEARADASEKARLIGQQYRAQEAQHQARKAQAEAEYGRRIADLETRLSAAVADRNRLRVQIASFAAGPPAAADDSLSAARHRAEVLGLLLAAADERAERDARELEALNAEKRLLLDAWPR